VRDPQATPRATQNQADSVIVDSALVLPKARILQLADSNSPAARRARRDSMRVARMGVLDEPRYVMLRSLLVPGWGQLHNHAWFKAALVAGIEGWFVSDLVGDREVITFDPVNWWAGFLLLAAALDLNKSYVVKGR
jgi:hypothetical protein